MSESTEIFWSVIAKVNEEGKGELEASIASFRKHLESLDDERLLSAVQTFRTAMEQAYDHRLWSAAYLMLGGCGDDSFWDFRAGLVSLGQEVFERVLADPDYLAEVPDIEERSSFEGFQYVPTDVIKRRGLTERPVTSAGEPSGEWVDEDEQEAQFPRIAARFC